MVPYAFTFPAGNAAMHTLPYSVGMLCLVAGAGHGIASPCDLVTEDLCASVSFPGTGVTHLPIRGAGDLEIINANQVLWSPRRKALCEGAARDCSACFLFAQLLFAFCTVWLGRSWRDCMALLFQEQQASELRC